MTCQKFLPFLVLVFLGMIVEDCVCTSYSWSPPGPSPYYSPRPPSYSGSGSSSPPTSRPLIPARGSYPPLAVPYSSPTMPPTLPGPSPYYPPVSAKSPSPDSSPYPATPPPPTMPNPPHTSPTMPPTLPGPVTYNPPIPVKPPSPSSSPYPSAPTPASYPPAPMSPEPYPPTPAHHPRAIKAAYWPSFDGFPATSIDTSYFTHIYYAFLLPDPETYKLNVTLFDQEKLPEFMAALQGRIPSVTTMLSIGGGGGNSTVFSQMASNRRTRAAFIESTIEVARKYGFDGVDLDWEFPANDQDMSNLGLLYRHWRKSLTHEAKITGRKRLLLSSAVYFASKVLSYVGTPSYPSDAISRYVDWISPMCFDYHGSWENFTGLHSSLYDSNSNISTRYGIGSWIQAGLPPEKLVMGLPLYGRSWILQDPNVTGVGAPALGNVTLTYSEILDSNSKNSAVVKLDTQMVGYYSYAGNFWIGYDDVGSIRYKVQFARLLGLRGYFFWALGQDKEWIISKQASKSWDC